MIDLFLTRDEKITAILEMTRDELIVQREEIIKRRPVIKKEVTDLNRKMRCNVKIDMAYRNDLEIALKKMGELELIVNERLGEIKQEIKQQNIIEYAERKLEEKNHNSRPGNIWRGIQYVVNYIHKYYIQSIWYRG